MKIKSFKYLWTFGWSFLSLLIERIWQNFWMFFVAVMFFISAALLDIPHQLGSSGHLIFFIAFIIAFLVALYLGVKSYPRIRITTIDRAIEQQSHLSHRPLATLKDHPIDPENAHTVSLWHRHIEKTRGYLNRLRIYRPRLSVKHKDPYLTRYVAIALLAISLLVAYPETQDRLAQNLLPHLSLDGQTQMAAMAVWIVPPKYTNKPTVFLSSAQNNKTLNKDADITVPENSTVKVRLSGYRFFPNVYFADHEIALDKTDPKNRTAEFKTNRTGVLKLSRFFMTIKSWDVQVITDTPPEITLVTTEKAVRSALKISYIAKDDYALQKLTGVISAPHLQENLTFNIPFSSVSDQGIATHLEDLTWHPLAGSKVTLEIIATDAIHQKTTSNTLDIILPERDFKSTAAKRLIFERKRLLQHTDPISVRLARDTVLDIANRPSLYKGDPLIFLGLGMIVKRIVYDGDTESIQSIIPLLWDLALKIEDSGLTTATRELSDALQKFAQGLENKDTSKAELDRLLMEVQKKMQEYARALSQEMAARMMQNKKNVQLSPEIMEKLMQRIDVEKMMAEMRSMTQGDSREQMQKLAEYLKSGVENMDLDAMEKMRAAQQKVFESLEGLQQLIYAQQGLIEETEKLAPHKNAQPQSQEQQTLRKDLGDIMRTLGEMTSEIPENFGKADQEMKQSEEKLSGTAPKDSIPHQTETLKQLQDGMDDMLQQMADAMGEKMMSFGMLPQGMKFGEGVDPLGRGQGQSIGGDIDVPDEGERRRVQNIIRELRQRSNDQNRPPVERDYIERLLDTF